MGWKKLLKSLGKNVLAIIIGAVLGLISSVFYTVKVWLPLQAPQAGLEIIALLPVMIVLFSILGAVIGTVTGLLIYNLFLRKKK